MLGCRLSRAEGPPAAGNSGLRRLSQGSARAEPQRYKRSLLGSKDAVRLLGLWDAVWERKLGGWGAGTGGWTGEGSRAGVEKGSRPPGPWLCVEP